MPCVCVTQYPQCLFGVVGTVVYVVTCFLVLNTNQGAAIHRERLVCTRLPWVQRLCRLCVPAVCCQIAIQHSGGSHRACGAVQQGTMAFPRAVLPGAARCCYKTPKNKTSQFVLIYHHPYCSVLFSNISAAVTSTIHVASSILIINHQSHQHIVLYFCIGPSQQHHHQGLDYHPQNTKNVSAITTR